MKKQINLTDFFSFCGINCPKEIIITQDDGMYPFNEDPEANWTFYTLKGLPILRGQLSVPPKNVACIAVGNGVEAIAMGMIFPEIENLVLTDIDEGVVSGAVTNILNNLPHFKGKVIGKVGSLCDPLKETGLKFDLIFGNVPNLICKEDKDLSSGDEKGTFMKENTLSQNIPEKFIQWGMGTQYEFLKGAYNILAKGGSIISLVGMRFPGSMAGELFKSCNLKLQLGLPMGFKWQTQPEIDFIGYSELEQKYGVRFDFYLFDEAKEILRKAKISNPSLSISNMEMKNMLEGVEVSSIEALELCREKGTRCGHLVYPLRGIKE